MPSRRRGRTRARPYSKMTVNGSGDASSRLRALLRSSAVKTKRASPALLIVPSLVDDAEIGPIDDRQQAERRVGEVRRPGGERSSRRPSPSTVLISRARIAGRGGSGKPLTSWRRSKLSSHCLTSAGASFGASAVISPPNDHAPSAPDARASLTTERSVISNSFSIEMSCRCRETCRFPRPAPGRSRASRPQTRSEPRFLRLSSSR